jgi:NADH-quinone oxidoreductase subunit B
LGLEKLFGDSVITTTVNSVVNWARKNALWPMPFGTACCAIEMMATLSGRYDMSRFGAEVIRFSPRQADLMIVSGRVSIKMMPVLLKIYQQMPEPKWVISMGACASSGGVFDNYTIVQGVDQFLPVHVYMPGCPPRPETLLDALLKIQEIVEKGGSTADFQPPVLSREQGSSCSSRSEREPAGGPQACEGGEA